MPKCLIDNCNDKVTHKWGGEWLCKDHARAKLEVSVAFANRRHALELHDLYAAYQNSKITEGDVDEGAKSV